jgi:hypothetical protein
MLTEKYNSVRFGERNLDRKENENIRLWLEGLADSEIEISGDR